MRGFRRACPSLSKGRSPWLPVVVTRILLALLVAADVCAVSHGPAMGAGRESQARAGRTGLGLRTHGPSLGAGAALDPRPFANVAEEPALQEHGGGGSERDVMMGWKDEGQADPDVVAAMLGLRNHGEENRTVAPLAIGVNDALGVAVPHAPEMDGGSLAELPCSEIRKPDTDARDYAHVKLANGLQAVLVSDPEAHSAAAALCVSVGQLDDPESVQGLAHFLEHMLFLGTEKYPEESNFDQFCAAAAGYSNAWTSLDHTMYHFIVANSKLEEALDRFASFFSCPLFSPSGTEREMKAVDSEHNKNLQDDDRREYQLMRGTSSPSHPMSRFGAGSLQTLLDMPKLADPPVDVRQELLAFHKRQYGASRLLLIPSQPCLLHATCYLLLATWYLVLIRMRLAVIGKEPSATLR
jgi:hypothetical protein